MDKPPLMLEINIPAPGLRPGAGFLHAYTGTLIKEIEQSVQDLSEYDIKTLYIHGAGGPGDLDLRVLTRTLRQKLDIAEAEKIVDLKPERISTANFSTYQNFRTNLYRINLGSLNYVDFHRLNPPYEYDHYTWIQKLLSYSDVTNVCIEHLLGMQGQSKASLRDSLNRVLEFYPDGICFVPVADKESDESDPANLLDFADGFIRSKGYERISVYEYAKPCKGSLRTSLQTSECEYWGMGVGSVSFLDGCILTGTDDPDAYIRSQGEADKIITRAVRLDVRSRMLNRILRALYATDGVCMEEIQSTYGDTARFAKESVLKLLDEGLACKKNDRIVLTSRGAMKMPMVRKILTKAD